jgi:hypothetical protein
MARQTAAGWYSDLVRRAEFRYFDGRAWTEHCSRDGQAFLDPQGVKGLKKPPRGAPVEGASPGGGFMGVGDAESPLENLERTFRAAKLVVPPIPRRFRDELRILSPWAWATRDVDPFEMYMFRHDRELLGEGLAGEARDYLAISHRGHGINSYGLSYFVDDGPVSVFAQVGWGGGYMDETGSAAAFAECCEGVTALLETGAEVGSNLSARVLVVFSDFRAMRSAGWRDAALLRTDPGKWVVQHTCEDPFGVARALLRGTDAPAT